MTDQEDYPRVVKQDTRRLEDVARACRDYMTEMRPAIAAVAVAVVVVAAVAGSVERKHPSDDWVSKGRIAAAAAGYVGNCKQGCTASSLPAIAEELHLLGSEEVLEMVEVPNLEEPAWVDTEE